MCLYQVRISEVFVNGLDVTPKPDTPFRIKRILDDRVHTGHIKIEVVSIDPKTFINMKRNDLIRKYSNDKDLTFGEFVERLCNESGFVHYSFVNHGDRVTITTM